MNYFVYVNGILGVCTNATEFAWSYGTVAPKASEEEFEKCMIKVFLEIRKSNDVFDKQITLLDFGKYHYFSANKNERKIYYERNFLGNSKLRYSIQFTDNEIHVVVGSNYMKYIKYRIMNLHSMHYILTDLMAAFLLTKGIATIHCSAVSTDERSIIFFAPPNTGKTLTSIQLCKNQGFKFIAEDFALTDGENIWSVPWTSTFRYYNEINESKMDTLINRLTSYVPILEFISFKKNKSIDQYLGDEKIKHLSKATDVVVLERGIPGINRDKGEGLQKIINLNRYEFNYHKSPAAVVMNYFNPDFFSLDQMYEKEKGILRNLVDRCNYLSITENDASKYWKVVLQEVVGKS